MTDPTVPAAPAPGWYADPSAPPGSGGIRWWDGTTWTEHVSLPAGTAPGSGSNAAPRTPDGVEVADWGRRLGAYVIDSVLLGVVSTLVSLPVYVSMMQKLFDSIDDSFDPVTGAPDPDYNPFAIYGDIWPELLVTMGISIVVALLYHAIMLKLRAATVGKQVLGLRVRPWESDGPLSWSAVLKRVGLQFGLFQLLSWVYVPILDGLWPLWDKRRQALHDKVASTVVVQVPSRR